jgi:DNA-directed RNA polymerase specialized sigma24 family protein
MTRAWIQWKRLRQLEDPDSWVLRVALRKPRTRWRLRRRGVRPRVAEGELASMDPQNLAALCALLQQPETGYAPGHLPSQLRVSTVSW